MPEEDKWSEWARHVLAEQERLNKVCESLEQQIRNNHVSLIREMQDIKLSLTVEVARLKVQSGVWGGIAGLVSVAAFVFYQLMKD